jgi:hypothetical protein
MEYYNLYPHKFEESLKDESIQFLEKWIEDNEYHRSLLNEYFQKPQFFPYFKVSDNYDYIIKLIGRYGYLMSPCESSKGYFKYIVFTRKSTFAKVKFKVQPDGKIFVFDKEEKEIQSCENYDAFRNRIIKNIVSHQLDIHSPRITFLYHIVQESCSKIKPTFPSFLFRSYFTPNERSIEITFLQDQTKVFFNFDILIQWSATLRILVEDLNESRIKDIEIPNGDFLGFTLYIAMKMNPSKDYTQIPKNLLFLFEQKQEFSLEMIFDHIYSIYCVANYLGDDSFICGLYILIKDNYSTLDKSKIQNFLDVIQF